ncbi:MAG: sulfite exporter TauE/SafE family protein, partial [Butyrivibrio sp.]|nr:sulfite exporter TauE/SafE family protein [Butyrivibrio sp.]
LTGAVSHFVIDGMPNLLVLVLCVLFTLLWARIAARIANRVDSKLLNQITGAILLVLGIIILAVNVF